MTPIRLFGNSFLFLTIGYYLLLFVFVTPTSALDPDYLLESLQVEQGKFFEENQKYQYQPIIKNSVGFSEVHEYVSGKDKSSGYQTFFYDKTGRLVSSVGFGIEAKERTFDIIYATATST